MVGLVGLSWWCCNTIALCKEINGLSIVRVGENPKLGEKLGQCGTLFRGSKRLATADELQDEVQLNREIWRARASYLEGRAGMIG